MSLIEDLDKFAQYELEFGNKYAAVNKISDSARKLLSKYENVPLESEAISWVLRGIDSKTLNKVVRIQRRKHFYLSYVDEVLCYIDDKDVKDSVKESIRRSKQVQNLVYFYKTYDESKQARIRILVRIIWYELFLDK